MRRYHYFSVGNRNYRICLDTNDQYFAILLEVEDVKGFNIWRPVRSITEISEVGFVAFPKHLLLDIVQSLIDAYQEYFLKD